MYLHAIAISFQKTGIAKVAIAEVVEPPISAPVDNIGTKNVQQAIAPGHCLATTSGFKLTHSFLIFRLNIPWEILVQSHAQCAITDPWPEIWNLWVWPLKGHQFLDSSLLTKAIDTILNRGSPSTRKLYALDWRLFRSWCEQHHLDPINCQIGTMMDPYRNATGIPGMLTNATLNVSVAAVFTNHETILEASNKDASVYLSLLLQCQTALANVNRWMQLYTSAKSKRTISRSMKNMQELTEQEKSITAVKHGYTYGLLPCWATHYLCRLIRC